MSKVKIAASPKCCMCDKSVYKAEETAALGRTYHKTCFTCGGSSSDGCNKVLELDKYISFKDQPYCKNCQLKLSRKSLPAEESANGVSLPLAVNVPAAENCDESGEQTPKNVGKILAMLKELSKPDTDSVLPQATRKVSIIGTSPKCAICEKSVYKVEELQACGKYFHKSCFICSGNTGDGCKRVLNLSKYMVHDNDPYCDACFGRLYKPKGFGFGSNLTTDYGKSPEDEIEKAKTVLGTTEISPVLNSEDTNKARSASIITPTARKMSVVAAASPKCYLCTKTVYKVEEVNAVEHVWHKTCFTCSGAVGDGCKRVLTLDKYLVHSNEPYCNACFSKMFKPKGFGFGSNLNTDYGKTPEDEVKNAKIALSSQDEELINIIADETSDTSTVDNSILAGLPPATKPRSSSTISTNPNPTRKMSFVAAASPKCYLCTKTVYKVEEVNAVEHVWHKTCFTCSGAVGDGCKRVLTLDKYLVHSNEPYCNACFSKMFKPKGFGFGSNLNTDYGKTPEDEIENAKLALATGP